MTFFEGFQAVVMAVIFGYIVVEVATFAYIVYNRKTVVPLIRARLQYLFGITELNWEIAMLQRQVKDLTPKEKASEPHLYEVDDFGSDDAGF
jgi:hypothetical protein